MAKFGRFAFIAVLTFLILAGVLAGMRQLQQGLSATALHEPVVWGLYVTCFVFFVGLGAGALFIGSLAVCSGKDQFHPIARAGSIISLVSLILAGLFITMDLGRPERAYLLLTKAQLESPLILDFLVVNVLIGIAALYTLFAFRAEALSKDTPAGIFAKLLAIGGKPGKIGQFPKLLRLLAGIMVIGIPILYLLTVRLFASLRAHPEWNATVLGPVFLTSALLAGLAATSIIAGLGNSKQKEPGSANQARRLVINGLIILIIIDILISLSPLATMRQFDSSAELTIWSHINGFTIAELVIGLLVPLAFLLAVRNKPNISIAVPGVLILIGVFLKRWHIINSGMLNRSLPLPDAAYFPNLVEFTIALGIFAFGIMLLYLLTLLLRQLGTAEA